ncbi:hypothetical protein [Peptacetobacter hiranonis]|uniref:Uncharacterized protein n=1 Tax=Peptacetobacter hiranonis (strain DSM 13275 / JCM 10541 / KCTC 15199 / TO-931) TaxID=500633 RepID=B6FWY4_PEPHT|nr:hypothetical protein [Peptacetobacter hiranonis]EEA86045.1 hypothetical protein CLOHIR_00383 [Peptacetobacter hiranonis DSM 13275]QEK21070.1 hypothetical protein KGNDJEFE_01557 [Peptacetobacter hiranonis]
MPSAKTTPNLGLNAWEGNETVRREDFYNDNQKVDKAVGDLKTAIENIDLADTNISIIDAKNKFEGTTLDKVLDEIDDKIVDTNNKVDNIDLSANKVKYTDTHKLGATDVQKAIDALATKVKALETKTQSLEQELTGQVARLSGINTELETEIGTPTV